MPQGHGHGYGGQQGSFYGQYGQQQPMQPGPQPVYIQQQKADNNTGCWGESAPDIYIPTLLLEFMIITLEKHRAYKCLMRVAGICAGLCCLNLGLCLC
nr:uncharacterized protein I303_08173 [Kwoniella dejecticola CBS 10117]OBR81403.1 hypothetical protein I303_08173 [Kwoniella dejecticola CBS 10117]